MESQLSSSADVGTRRMQRHREIRGLINKNLVEQAIVEINQTVVELGPHVGILCELASCYYELGRFQECWTLVAQIESQYHEFHARLSRESKMRTALMLAKFFEEMAEPAIALQWLASAHDHAEVFEDRKSIFANELRILAYFGFGKNLQKKYAAATEFANTGESTEIEMRHGLMWAEWSLFGFEHARIRRLELERETLNELDRRLIARDFLEIWLLSNAQWHTDVENARAQLASLTLTDFDRALLEYTVPNRPRGLSLAMTDVSDMSALRLLLLQINAETDLSLQRELKIKFGFLTDGLSKESKMLFKKIAPTLDETGFIDLTILSGDKKITSRKLGFSLAVTSLQLKFLTVFREHNEHSLDAVAMNLWGEKCSESIYHRIRMLAYKLNEELGAKTGLTPFEIKKEGARLHSSLKIFV